MTSVTTFVQQVAHRLRPASAAHALKRQAMLTPASRRLAVALLRPLLPKHVVATPTRLDARDTALTAATLASDGVVRLGKMLSDDDVGAIVTYANTLRCFDPWPTGTAAGARFPPQAPPPTCHTAHFEKADILRSSTLMGIVNDGAILDVARRFLGATPTIANVSMWWSYAGRPQPLEAQHFHRDYDDLKFCKLFVYLTDVDMDSGPHVYVRQTANRWGFTHAGARAKRYDDDEVIRAFGAARLDHLCEPKGHAFLVDTFGLHKGLLPRARNRLVLQCQYSLFPTGYDDYPESRRVPAFGAWDPYVNRLNFKG